MAAAAEDAVLRRILAITLDSSAADASASPPVVFLPELAQELPAGQLTADDLDRAVVARLIEAPPASYPQHPLHYLLACFARADGELRGLPAASAGDAAQLKLRATIVACQELLVSYAALILTGAGVVPEPEAAAQRGALQLFDALNAAASASQSQAFSPPPGQGQIVRLPHGFLEQLAAQQEADTLAAIMRPIASELARAVQACSPLGGYAAPLSAVKQLVSIEPLARVLVGLPTFKPDLAAGTGRAIQLPGASWLGPCFSPSAIPDELIKAEPDVAAACFAGFSLGKRTQGDLKRHLGTLHIAQRHIGSELAAIVKALLGKGTRPAMLGWLAGLLEGNRERSKMQVDMNVAASHGLFANLTFVLLKLCGPFLNPGADMFWKRVDWRYVGQGRRLDFSEDTRLAMTQPQAEAWAKQQQQESAAAAAGSSGDSAAAAAAAPDHEWHFVCEAFFMTLKALHLGPVKVISDLEWQQRVLGDLTRQAQELEDALSSVGGTDSNHPQARMIALALARTTPELHKLEGALMGAEAVLGDPDLAADCLAFYRLLAAWLLSLVLPDGASDINCPSLPLPEQVPPRWAALPEWFVEDLADYLLFLSRAHPELLEGVPGGLEGLMLFMVVFIGSPTYLKNPFLRGKLTDVLHAWLPREDAGGFRRAARMRGVGASVSHLFEGHPLVLQHMVPSLLNLYADVEVTDRNNQFYEKFSMRQSIGDILIHCWSLQAHKDAWRAYAAQAGGRGPYLRFANMLVNDSIYLLDEALKKVQDLRRLEAQLADPQALAALTQQQQQEARRALADTGGHLRSLVYLAGGTINTLAVSTTEVTASFLLPEMVERVAAMLNYFLMYLTGPERRNLKVRDPEKYQFNPKQLLAQICTVYLNLAHADRSGVFSAAIASDARSYRPQMFSEAALVLRQFSLLPEARICGLESLAGRVAQAAVDGAAEEEALGDDTPDEFLDPITYTLMRDPVRLPSSDTVMDRATIMRHLLSDARDPINREPLTPDMLVPEAALAARIATWLAAQRASGGGAGGGAGGGGAGAMEQG